MKKHLINALVAVALLATLNSCSKDEQVKLKPVTTADNPLDPGNYGYYQIVTGEIYFYKDSITDYGQVTEHYLQLKPLSLEKYKNGALLDSVCNKDLAVYFESKGVKSQDKTALWGVVPQVTAARPPIVTVNSADYMFKLKMSKMVTGFGFEINSPYTGKKLGVHISYWNSKLNKQIPDAEGIRYLEGSGAGSYVPFGQPGGATTWGVEATRPFDEVRVKFEEPKYAAPDPIGPFEISFSGFRYKLAK
jgi:hypothetical protein